jgi:hypothetical protein
MAIMKFNTQNVIVAGAILFVMIIVMLNSTKTFIPYYEDSIFTHNYPYEGFEQMHNSQDYLINATNQGDSYKSFLINPSADACKKIYGFEGLYCSPSTPDAKLDQFGDIKGSVECVGKSSGLTNSRGGLCLDSAHIALLKTRGGNQTGADFQIGN